MKTVNITTDNPKHSFIVKAILARKLFSEQENRDRIFAYNKAEEDFAAYMPTKDADQLRKQKRDAGSPQYTTILVPYSYAALMGAHTYWSSVLLSRSPVWQYMGRTGEPEMNVMAVEALCEYQTTVGNLLPALYVWLMDAGKYGLGVIWHSWESESIYVREISDEPITVAGMPLLGKTKSVATVTQIPGYQGGRGYNVRPHDYLNDPRVPFTDPDLGEFVGRKFPMGYNEIQNGINDGSIIKSNGEKVLQRMRSGNANNIGDYDQGSSQVVLPGTNNSISPNHAESGLTTSLNVVEMVIEVIPSMWGLGSTTYPEKWVFLVTNPNKSDTSGILLSARPYGMYHNRFPACILESEIEGYGMNKRSLLDIGRPMNDIITWLFNSHFYAVRKSLNGEIVYDPSRVYTADINDREPGKRIRLRPEAYGTDVNAAITTLGPDAAVTQQNLGDMRVAADLLNRIVGVTDNVMGQMTPGGRKSATEVRSANTGSIGRLKTITEYFSATGFSRFGDILLRSAQQLYDREDKLRVAGMLPNNMNNFIDVNPATIAGNFDYIPVDGTLPVDRMATVNMFSNLLNTIQRFPQFTAQYDVGKIIAYIAQMGGIKNLNQFKVQMASPEQLAQQQQQGNIIPVGGGANGNGSGSPGGVATDAQGLVRAEGAIPDPTQLAGLGRAG